MLLCFSIVLSREQYEMFRALVFFCTTFRHPDIKLFNLVSLMESLDSTLETKRPAAALNLLSQQKKPQVAVSSEGQYWTGISIFTLKNYFPVGDMVA